MRVFYPWSTITYSLINELNNERVYFSISARAVVFWKCESCLIAELLCVMTGLLLGLWLAYHSLCWKETEWSGERKIPSLPWREWWCTFPAAVIISPPLAVAVRHHYAPIEFYSAISCLLLPLSLAQDDRVAPTPGEEVVGVCLPARLPQSPSYTFNPVSFKIGS